MRHRASRAATLALLGLAAGYPRDAQTSPRAAPPGHRRAVQRPTVTAADLTPGAGNSLGFSVSTAHGHAGRQGGSIVASVDQRLIYAIDEDNGAIVAIDATATAHHVTSTIGGHPVAALALADGRVLVVDRAHSELIECRASEAGALVLASRHALPAEPVAITASPDERTVFVSSAAAAKLSALDARTFAVQHEFEVPREPRGIAVTPSGAVFVAHVVGGVISAIDPTTQRVAVVRLPAAPERQALDRAALTVPDDATQQEPQPASRGRTVTALARSLVLSPDASRLYVAHIAESTGSDLPLESRSVGYGGIDEATINALSPATTVSTMDLRTGRWITAERPSHGATRLAGFADPSALAFDSSRHRVLLLGLGTAAVASLEPIGSDPALHGVTESLPHCDGASGLVSLASGRVFVNCAFDHSVRVLDASMHAYTSVETGPETLESAVALGRRLFHRLDDRISRTGFTCGTCHPDGREDANVWSSEFGNRQTPSLDAHLADTAPYQWNGHAPTLDLSIQQTVIRLSGLGLPRADRDALAAYLTRGIAPRSATAAITPPDLARGANVFATAGCADCHDPEHHFVDAASHDIRSASTGDALAQFDTPSLEGVAFTAPYFHDGRYASLESLLTENHDRMGHTARLDANDTRALLAYLRSL